MKVWILMGSHGEYSDRTDEPELAFTSEAPALVLRDKLNAVAAERNRARRTDSNWWNSEARRTIWAAADAAARDLGFPDGMPGDSFEVMCVELRDA